MDAMTRLLQRLNDQYGECEILKLVVGNGYVRAHILSHDVHYTVGEYLY